MRTHDDLRDLLGAYALDAVEPDERRALDQHLRTCADCRREITEHQEALAGLAEPVAPPPQVWERIETAAREDDAATVVPLRPRRPRLVAALSAAAVVAFAFLGWRVAVLDARLERVAGDTLVASATAALADPEAERVVLRSGRGTLAVDAVVLPDGRGYVLQGNLDALPEDQTYQLWAMVGEQPISVGVLGTEPSVTAFRVGSGTSALAITVERAGGAPQPTSDPIAHAPLSVA